MADKYVVSSAPHLGKAETIPGIMWRVNAALLPAALVGIGIFGPAALKLMVVTVVTAVATEFVIQKGRRQKIAVMDGSAFMTGLLLAFNLPAHAPWWVGMIGSIFAVAIAKQAFGGLGRNIFNPALAARAFLMAAWPKHLTTFTAPFSYDAVTQATPLALLKEGRVADFATTGLTYKDLLMGNRGGCLGEVCILALLAGGLYLLWKRIISWQTPIVFIATVGLFAWIFGSKDGYFRGDFLFHILSGGLILGAVFMATDYVTSPITRKGQVIFALGCGLLTSVIRLWGGYPEGVCYAILIMNCTVPLIDRFVKNRRYGVGR